MGDVRLTEEEREALYVALYPDARPEWYRQASTGEMRSMSARVDLITPAVEAILAARLAAVEALADECERLNAYLCHDVSTRGGGYQSVNRRAWTVLRAALAAAETPGRSETSAGAGGGDGG